MLFDSLQTSIRAYNMYCCLLSLCSLLLFWNWWPKKSWRLLWMYVCLFKTTLNLGFLSFWNELRFVVHKLQLNIHEKVHFYLFKIIFKICLVNQVFIVFYSKIFVNKLFSFYLQTERYNWFVIMKQQSSYLFFLLFAGELF